MLKPERLNQLDIDTRWGFRSFEVWHGDITKLNFPINLLLIAQPGRYPTYSLHRSLQSELSISVHDLKATQELDFVQPLGVWVSRRIENERVQRILCMEILPDNAAPQKIREAFRVFPILAMREIDIGTICLPILGAGGIGLRAEDVVGPILDGSLWTLTNIKETNRICFVDIDREKAHAMSGAMDDVLGRVKLTIAKGEDAERLRRAVSSAVDKAETIDSDIYKVALEIRAAIKPEGRSVQVGNAGRQLSEYILQQILPASASRSLFDKIEEAIPLVSADRIDNLRELPAAKWMNGLSLSETSYEWPGRSNRVSPPSTQSGWRVTANRAMLLLDG